MPSKQSAVFDRLRRAVSTLLGNLRSGGILLTDNPTKPKTKNVATKSDGLVERVIFTLISLLIDKCHDAKTSIDATNINAFVNLLKKAKGISKDSVNGCIREMYESYENGLLSLHEFLSSSTLEGHFEAIYQSIRILIGSNNLNKSEINMANDPLVRIFSRLITVIIIANMNDKCMRTQEDISYGLKVAAFFIKMQNNHSDLTTVDVVLRDEYTSVEMLFYLFNRQRNLLFSVKKAAPSMTPMCRSLLEIDEMDHISKLYSKYVCTIVGDQSLYLHMKDLFRVRDGTGKYTPFVNELDNLRRRGMKDRIGLRICEFCNKYTPPGVLVCCLNTHVIKCTNICVGCCIDPPAGKTQNDIRGYIVEKIQYGVPRNKRTKEGFAFASENGTFTSLSECDACKGILQLLSDNHMKDAAETKIVENSLGKPYVLASNQNEKKFDDEEKIIADLCGILSAYTIGVFSIDKSQIKYILQAYILYLIRGNGITVSTGGSDNKKCFVIGLVLNKPHLLQNLNDIFTKSSCVISDVSSKENNLELAVARSVYEYIKNMSDKNIFMCCIFIQFYIFMISKETSASSTKMADRMRKINS